MGIWQATLNVDVTDDLGHEGHGGCDGGSVPSPQKVVRCSSWFQK